MSKPVTWLVCERCPCSPQVWRPIPTPEKCRRCGADLVLHYETECAARQLDQIRARLDALEASRG